MAAADLDGPLVDFYRRTKQLREVMVAIESASKKQGQLTTSRQDVDLAQIDGQTENTTNAMALVFLAASFEEFVREVAIQCGNYLTERYASLALPTRHAIRDAYWQATRDRLRFTKSVLVNKTPDPALLGQVRSTLDALQGFVVNDDASKLSSAVFAYHSNNFRPGVVEEILGRLGIGKLLSSMAENSKLKAHFGVTKKEDCERQLRAKWNEFYEHRNRTVHSLGGASGYAVDAVVAYLVFFELIADSMKVTLARTISTW